VSEQAVAVQGGSRPVAVLSVVQRGSFVPDSLLSRTLRHVAHEASVVARRGEPY
jgi:hypothetical protein